ncbi:MAG: response regulator [Propionibacteriaceae bacterium]|nr:response regulator [Propionibacteriaceae bacterium]
MSEQRATETAAVRLGILARLADAMALAEDPEQVGVRAAAVLRQNDADHAQVWLLEVQTPGHGEVAPGVSSAGPVLDPAGNTPEAHALAVAAARSGRHEVQALYRPGDSAELHARPIVEPGQAAPSLVLVVATPGSPGVDAEFADYLELAASLIGAGLSGLRELAVERQHSETLRELDAAKSAFLANVSHELRTPLALIVAPLQEVLGGEEELGGRLRERLSLVRNNVVRLRRMVDAMLDFSRLEAGRIVPNLVEVDVAALLRSLAAGFGPAIERAGLEFVVDVPDLPRQAQLDRDIIERIVLNLLSNALKYTPRGSVTLQLRPVADGFQVAVDDTGIGIGVRDQDRVFARFEQLPRRSQARSSEGAGIGLAMVKELTELLGGSVDLRSAPGRGSRFTIRLPYLPPVATEGEAGARSITPRGVAAFLAEADGWEEATQQPAVPPQAPVDRPRLLVAEDSADMGRYLAEVLSDAYEVEVVGDGLQALAAARARRPDAILSDVMMPGLGGFSLVGEIRADPVLKDLPVLLLSARAGQEASAAGLEHGADDYLVKPFEVADLRARLASNIRRAADRSLDASWRRAVVDSMQEAVIIADKDGLVTGLNDAFTQLLGWRLVDGPFRPPYPWWPDAEAEPEAFARISEAHDSIVPGHILQGDFQLRDRLGRTVWASYHGGVVEVPGRGRTAILKTLRDATRDHLALERRQAAARVVADLAAVEHLDQLVGIAVHGLHALFDGDSTVQVAGAGESQTFTATGPVEPGKLPDAIAVRLAGVPLGEADHPARPVDGILLVPQSLSTGTRAWVQFDNPRVVSSDEQIVADLIAQAFALAVDRVLTVGELADRQANLEKAVESHRAIGQAVGILVERHRITPGQAFQQLRRASQDRNVRLREVAQRVIDTGLDPSEA